MLKTELVEELAIRAGLTKKDAKKFVNIFSEIITEELQKGEKVSVPGLGFFEAVYYKARTSRNPAKGETIEIEGSYCPKFRPNKSLRDAMKKIKK